MGPNEASENWAVFLILAFSMVSFLRWGSGQKEQFFPEFPLLFLFQVMPWRCEKNRWIWPKLFFVGAELCFIMSVGAGIVSLSTGSDTLVGQSLFWLAGMFFREVIRSGMLDDDYGVEWLGNVFDPW